MTAAHPWCAVDALAAAGSSITHRDPAIGQSPLSDHKSEVLLAQPTSTMPGSLAVCDVMGARLRGGGLCLRLPAAGKRRCRRHGGGIPNWGAPAGNRNALKHGAFTATAPRPAATPSAPSCAIAGERFTRSSGQKTGARRVAVTKQRRVARWRPTSPRQRPATGASRWAHVAAGKSLIDRPPDIAPAGQAPSPRFRGETRLADTVT
jgi:hypothetical protein